MHGCRRSQEIEPGFCEPSYYIGVTSLALGDGSTGLAELLSSLSCHITADAALQELNSVILSEQKDPSAMLVRAVFVYK